MIDGAVYALAALMASRRWCRGWREQGKWQRGWTTAAAGLGCGAAIAPDAAPAVSAALTSLLAVLAHSPVSDCFALAAFAARGEAQRSVLVVAAGCLVVRGGDGQHGAHVLVATLSVLDWWRGRLAAPVGLAGYTSLCLLSSRVLPSALRWAGRERRLCKSSGARRALAGLQRFYGA